MDDGSSKNEEKNQASVENDNPILPQKRHKISNELATGTCLRKNDDPTVKALGNKARNRHNEMKAKRHHILRIGESDVLNNKRKDGPTIEKLSRPGLIFTGVKKKRIPRKRRRINVNKDVIDCEKVKNCSASVVIDEWIPDVSHLLTAASLVTKEDMEFNTKSKLKFSNCVQLHGVPKQTNLNSIRRFFSGLSILRIVILLPCRAYGVQIVEWDAKNDEQDEFTRKSCNKKGRNDTIIERCKPSVRIWVQFDSTTTASLACERSKEHITTGMFTSRTKQLNINPKISTSEREIAIDHDEDQKPIKTPSPPVVLGKAAIAVLPVPIKRVAKYVMNNFSIDTRHLVGLRVSDDSEEVIKNDSPLEAIVEWIEDQLDPTVTQIMLSATVQELNLTCHLDSPKMGRIVRDPLTMFPLFHNQRSKNEKHSKSTSRVTSHGELQDLNNHCTFLERTLHKIEGRNRSLLLLSLDISDNNPLIAVTRTALKIILQEIAYSKYKLIRTERLEMIAKENKIL